MTKAEFVVRILQQITLDAVLTRNKMASQINIDRNVLVTIETCARFVKHLFKTKTMNYWEVLKEINQKLV